MAEAAAFDRAPWSSHVSRMRDSWERTFARQLARLAESSGQALVIRADDQVNMAKDVAVPRGRERLAWPGSCVNGRT